ncbi:MAG: PAS domain S-box protein, partial [Thiogranum sp.]
QAQTELRQRENYLSLTLNSIGDAVIATDARGRISRMNPVAESLTGWRQNDAQGQPLPEVFKIINAHSREPVDNPVEKVLASGQIVGLANHTVLIARDGNEYQIADSGAPIMDEKGKILGVILVFRNVTEEYRQQEALCKTRHNLTEAQQLAHIGNWELDLVKDTLEWSDEIFRIFEIDPEQFQPSYEGFLNAIHPDDRDRVNQAYTDSLENKAPYNITHRLLMKDGRIKYVHEFCSTHFDDHGQPLRSIGLVQDITERKKIEDERFKSACEWTQAMDSISDAIYLIDLDDRVIRANKTFYQLTGLKPEQVIGHDINQLMHPEGEPAPCPVCQARKAREDALIVMEASHPDNPVQRPIEIMLRVVRDTHEDPVSILMRIRDLTRQREIENRLRQQQEYLEVEVEKRTAELTQVNKELEAFSYSISHDLRAPLRAINGFATALCEDYAEKFDDTANDYLARISAGANRMATLIDDLLMLSRINRQEINKSPCNLSHMAHNIRLQLEEQHPRDNLQWKIQEQLSVKGDLNLIHVALENMFSNALKYSSKKDHALIEFGCEQQEGKTVFYIRDNGAGFDMQYSNKLFGAFQRLHGREFEGTGIGLATVQRIIHQHGGKIWAEAEVDRGATFYFTLD